MSSTHSEGMQGVSVVRSDGTRGAVVARETSGNLVIEFTDGSRRITSLDSLVPQNDGTYLFRVDAAPPPQTVTSENLVIPVVAEELTIETVQVARAKVRVQKRIETREEIVDVPSVVEEVVVERIPINKVIENADSAPTVREEDGVLIIPLLEEVPVVQTQLVLREEVRVFKRRTTTTTPQTVVLRREVVDIQREDLTGTELPES